MELDDVIIALQTLFRDFERVHGRLKLIQHIGGNELIINEIVTGYYQFIEDKDSTVKLNLLKILLLNTEFPNEDHIMNTENIHLANVLPKLSKLILSSIVIGKNESMIAEFCSFPNEDLFYTCALDVFECINELVTNLEYEKQSEIVHIIIECIIRNINAFNGQKYSSCLQNVNNIIGKLLMHLTVHPSVKTKGTLEVIHMQIGNTLNNLLKLLLICNIDKKETEKIANALMVSTCAVMKFVTVDVFCTWAENTINGQHLQYTASVNAYKVIEKYSKMNSAAELIQLLGCMAKKPKSLSELIQQANIETVIYNVNEADENQRRWFFALLNFDKVLQNEQAIECISKWSHLCSENEAFLLLKLAMDCHENAKAKEVVFKCCSELSVETLSLVIGRFFWHFGKWVKYNEVDADLLTKTLNKVNCLDSSNCESQTKDFQLLFLQDPTTVSRALFSECLKKPALSCQLKNAFLAIKNPMTMTSQSLGILLDVINEGKVYISKDSLYSLWNLLIETNCIPLKNLIEQIVKPLIEQYYENLVVLKDILQVFQQLPIKELPMELKVYTAQTMLNILTQYRIKYTDFSLIQCEICIAAIEILLLMNLDISDMPDGITADQEKLNLFYFTWNLTSSAPNLLNYLYPDWSNISQNYGASVSKLIKILPRCMPREWSFIMDDLIDSCGVEKAAEILTDCILLVCEVTNSSKSESERKIIIAALQFCLKNYGICLKNLNDKENSVCFQSNVAKYICKILTVIPHEIRRQEGLSFISLLTDNALKNLSKDKQFVISLTKIDDTVLSQAIASKMLSL